MSAFHFERLASERRLSVIIGTYWNWRNRSAEIRTGNLGRKRLSIVRTASQRESIRSFFPTELVRSLQSPESARSACHLD